MNKLAWEKALLVLREQHRHRIGDIRGRIYECREQERSLVELEARAESEYNASVAFLESSAKPTSKWKLLAMRLVAQLASFDGTIL